MRGRPHSKETFFKRASEDENGCWIWNGALTKPFGYGWTGFRGTQMTAHRAAWILQNGDIPSGLYVCHKCDVPQCINPDHLFLGTPHDNVQDMWDKKRGRSPFKPGADGIKAKLSLEDVREIRNLLSKGVTHRAIASTYGVASSTVSRINTRGTWGELN